MRFFRKKVSTMSGILSVVFFFLALTFYTAALKLVQLGITEEFTSASAGMIYELYVLSLIAGTVTTFGCLVCLYLAIRLPKTKILKETYFFAVFVPLFSISSHIILNIVLRISPPTDLIVILGIIVGTPLSCAFAGYSGKTFWNRLGKLGLNQGITLLSLVFLACIPIVEILPEPLVVRSAGYIRYKEVVFKSGNDTTRVQGQITETTFTAEVPIPSDITFIAKQVVNITNQSPAGLDLKIHLEDLSGNLSKVEQLRVFFALGNGSEIYLLSFNNGNIEYEELSITMESHVTIAMGIVALARSSSSTGTTVMSLTMRLNDNNLDMNILVDSV